MAWTVLPLCCCEEYDYDLWYTLTRANRAVQPTIARTATCVYTGHHHASYIKCLPRLQLTGECFGPFVQLWRQELDSAASAINEADSMDAVGALCRLVVTRRPGQGSGTEARVRSCSLKSTEETYSVWGTGRKTTLLY